MAARGDDRVAASAGMQRAPPARLLYEPELLLLDEPTPLT
jgi:hypothetical protein